MNQLQSITLRVFFCFLLASSPSVVWAETITYSYDDLGRLTEANHGGPGAVFLRYSPHGNLLERTVLGDNAPMPDIKVNGSDGPIIIGQNDALSVTITCESGNATGQKADVWVLLATPLPAPNNLLHFDHTQGWMPGFETTSQGPLEDILEPIEILNSSGWPAGVYTYLYAFDLNSDGLVDELLYADIVEMTIQ